MTTKNTLVYLRPVKLVCMRVVGSYDETVATAWSKLDAWLKNVGVGPVPGPRYGFFRDNPSSVGAGSCRYDACLEVPEQFEMHAERDLSVVTLPAGPYLRSPYRGDADTLRKIVNDLHAGADLPDHLGYDSRRPLVTISLGLDEKNREKSDICLPVATRAIRAASAGHSASLN